jgi:ABC-2 type transport system permease protein
MSTTTERAPHAPATSSLPSAASIGLARIRLELRLFFRERDAVVFMFAYPVVMLAIFATVFGQQDAAPGFSYAQWFLPGMIATGVMLLSFQNLAIMISLERDDDGLKRLRATPMPASAYFIGKIGLVLVTSVVQTALLLVVAATLFDVPMPTSVSAWTTFAWVFALASATGCVCGIGFSSLPSSGRAASAVVSPVVIILQFISGVFFQYESLPSWMQQIASIFPLKWMAQGMRSVFLPASAETIEVGDSWQHGATAAVLTVWLVLGIVIGIRKFRWTRRDDR